MILLVRQIGFAGIGNLDKLVRKIRKEKLQQESSCQVLKAFVLMCDFFLKRYVTEKKFFCLFDLPNPQSRGFVNLMLKKNRHE